MKALKTQRRSIKQQTGSQLFEFFVEVKSKSKDRILNFVFQFIKNTKWHLGYADLGSLLKKGNRLCKT